MILKVDITSDTHNAYPRLPGGDLLIHAGDATMSGTENEIIEFAHYLNLQKYRKIIYVPGNHDFAMETMLQQMAKHFNPNIQILINNSCEWEGLKIFGSAYCPMFKDWAFGKNYQQRKILFSQIPDDTELLITHSPPYETLDQGVHGERLGCLALKEELENLPNVFLHVFGHIHESYGVKENSQRVSINASHGYRSENKPISLTINTVTKQVETMEIIS